MPDKTKEPYFNCWALWHILNNLLDKYTSTQAHLMYKCVVVLKLRAPSLCLSLAVDDVVRYANFYRFFLQFYSNELTQAYLYEICVQFSISLTTV